MSWRDYKDKKNKNILEARDEALNNKQMKKQEPQNVDTSTMTNQDRIRYMFSNSSMWNQVQAQTINNLQQNKLKNNTAFTGNRYIRPYDITKNTQNKENSSILNQESFDNIKKSINEITAYNSPNYGKGNIDLNKRPVVKNQDGSISTVRSMSFYDDNEKKEILIPTVVNGKIVSDNEAINHYYNTGEYLGKFDTVEEANSYAEQLHKEQEKRYKSFEVKDILKYNQENKKEEDQKRKEDFKNQLLKYNSEEVEKSNEIIKNGNIQEKTVEYGKEIGRSLLTGAVESVGNATSMLYNLPTKLGNAIGLKSVQQENARQGLGVSPENFTNNWKEIVDIENQRTAELDSGLQTTSRWSRTIGEMIPAILVGQGMAVGETAVATQKSASAISSFLSALNSASSTYNETLNEEQDNYLKAGLKATLYGIATHKIEGITGGNILNKFGSLDDLAVGAISKTARNELQKKIGAIAYGVFGETLEENVENWVDHLIDYAFGDADDITFESLLEEAKQTSIDTSAVTLILQGIGLGGSTYNDIKMYEANQAIDNANYLTDKQKTDFKNKIEQEQNPYLARELLTRAIQEKIVSNDTTMQNETVFNDTQTTPLPENKLPENVNPFNGYTEKEINNIQSDKIKIANNNDDIINFVKTARTKAQNTKIYLGKIKNNVSNFIKSKLGINVDNYNISLKNDDVRKIFKTHGNENTELPRGQVPIMEDDFLNIPNIINNYDTIELSGETQQGKPAITFGKNINGYNVVVTYVSDKHHNLELQTMYKFKNDKKIEPVTVLRENQTPELHTSETGSDIVLNNILPQNDNFVKVDINSKLNYNENNNSIKGDNNNEFGKQRINESNSKTTSLEGYEENGKNGEGLKRLKQSIESNQKQEKQAVDKVLQDELTNNLPISKNKANKIIDEIKNIENPTLEDVRKIISENNQTIIKYTDENVSAIRKRINETSFKLTDKLKNELRYKYDKLPRNIKYSNDGIEVDKFYKELRNMFPDEFTDSLNEADMLYNIVDFMRDRKAIESQTYSVLTDEELDTLSNFMLEASNEYKNIDNFYNEELNNMQVENSQNEGSFSMQQDEEVFREETDKLLNNELPKTKPRQFPLSVQESDYVSDEVKKENSRKILKTETGQYTPIGNQETIDKANEKIQNSGADNVYTSFNTKFENNEKITLNDIAEAELLIQHYSEIGDTEKAVKLIENVGILGTELGQQVQALSIIKKMTPQGQLAVANKLAERLSKKYDTDIEISKETQDLIKNSKMENIDDAMDKAYTEIADQLPLTVWERLDNFRFLMMLGNPKTHIRNMVGNTGNRVLTNVKNTVKGGIEDVIGMAWKDYQKNATIGIANKDQRTFAKLDAELLGEAIDDVGNKYNDNPNTEISKRKRHFDNKILNAMSKFNTEMLNKEDVWALKGAYRDALQNYMLANNLSSEDLTVLETDSREVAKQKEEALRKAREYASNQAKEATFHQNNAVANWFNNIETEGELDSHIGGLLLDAIVPFKRTPFNIVKQGVAYSPLNLIRSTGGFVRDINTEMKKLKNQYSNGKITQEQYNSKVSNIINTRIDQFSKGLTGTGIAVLGFLLSQMGILKAGNNDDEDKFDEALGNQQYSVQLGDHNVSLEWLSPSAMPFFIGAETENLIKQDSEVSSVLDLVSGAFSVLEPAFETTMLSNVTSALSSYNTDSSGKIEDILAYALSSYASQYVSSLMANITKTIDSTQRDTSSTKTGLEGTLDRFVKQQQAKIPRTI